MSRLFDDLDDLWKDRALPGEEDPRVLVAVMNHAHALEIARTEGWYRIPVRRAPPRIGADYLAFYQTAAFGPEERWKINYFAPIRRYRTVRRCDMLPQEADHPRAEDKYYKIEIGPLESLPHPVPSRRLRRVTFIPTTLKRLFAAEEINDLWLGTKIEDQLWQSFKEQGIPAERHVNVREEDEAYQVDFALYCEAGRVAILCDSGDFGNLPLVKESPTVADYDLTSAGWTALRLKPGPSPTWLEETLADIQNVVGKLGGPAETAQGA
jgi:hypothetical protein